jgi:hypothetical protein
MHPNPMKVILGASSLKAYVTAPRSFHVLGVVRFGMEYGLLATDSAGLYFRVNGSQALSLDGAEVVRALDCSYGLAVRLAATAPRQAPRAACAVPAGPPAPQVSIRKHRHVPLSAMPERQALHAASA